MKNERLSLLSNIQHAFNENQVGSTDYELARFFLQNYSKIASMNIYDVAEVNHVSRATVRRFCNRLGYDNFKSLKIHFEDFNEGIEKYRKFYSGTNFRNNLVAQTEYMMLELNKRMNTPEKNSIIKSMAKADQIFIFCSSRVISSVLAFQQELINFNLVIIVAENQDDIEILKSKITAKSLIIVFSITGVYVESIENVLEQVYSKKILFTLDRNAIYNRTFDNVYHFRSQENSRVNDQLYYTYGMNFILDILFKDYLDYKYKKEDK